MSRDSVFATGILKHGFGFSPKLLMKDPSVSIEAKAIYAYLASYAGAGMSSFPSVSLICHELGISRQRYTRHRKVLEQKRYITVEQVKSSGMFSHNVYHLNSCIDQPPTLQFATTEEPTTEDLTCNSNSLKSNNLNNPPNPQGGEEKMVGAKAGAQKIMELYNEVCGHVFTKSLVLNAKRQRQVANVCKIKLDNGKTPFADYNVQAWKAYFELLLDNPWNHGNNDRGWKATFDYSTRPDVVIKTLENKYA